IAGSPRGIAAGHDDARGGIVACHAPDRLSRALIGRGGHRAGVDDHEIGLGRRRARRAERPQLAFDLERVGLIDAAPAGDDRVLHEPSRALRPMSVRNCIPSKRTSFTARYAAAIAAWYEGPRPTTV